MSFIAGLVDGRTIDLLLLVVYVAAVIGGLGLRRLVASGGGLGILVWVGVQGGFVGGGGGLWW